MRKLSDKFMGDLLNSDGVLHPILSRVKIDHTLMLAIRENYINIYYRGGNIIKILEHNKGFYQASFDDQYNKSGVQIPVCPSEIKSQDDARIWVNSISKPQEYYGRILLNLWQGREGVSTVDCS